MPFARILPAFESGFSIYRQSLLDVTYTLFKCRGEAFILKNTYGKESVIHTFEIDDILANDWMYV